MEIKVSLFCIICAVINLVLGIPGRDAVGSGTQKSNGDGSGITNLGAKVLQVDIIKRELKAAAENKDEKLQSIATDHLPHNHGHHHGGHGHHHAEPYFHHHHHPVPVHHHVHKEVVPVHHVHKEVVPVHHVHKEVVPVPVYKQVFVPVPIRVPVYKPFHFGKHFSFSLGNYWPFFRFHKSYHFGTQRGGRGVY